MAKAYHIGFSTCLGFDSRNGNKQNSVSCFYDPTQPREECELVATTYFNVSDDLCHFQDPEDLICNSVMPTKKLLNN